MGAAVAAEWIKLRTLRSTFWALILSIGLSVGLGVVTGASFRSALDDPARAARVRFDPLFASLYSLTIGQLALVVFGVLVVGGEYSSGTIRASLAAVPKRHVFWAAKLLAGAVPAAAVSVVSVIATFVATQSALGPHGIALGTGDAPAAVAGACAYLTLLCVIAMGITAVLRSSVRALALLLPLLFLGSQGLGNVPAVRVVTRYLPDQAGMVLMRLTGPTGDPVFGPPYSAATGAAILAGWTVAAVVAGYVLLRRRDA